MNIYLLDTNIILLMNGYFIGRHTNVRSEELSTLKNTGGVQYTSSDQTENDSVSVIMVGDILLHDKVLENCNNNDGTYDFSSIFAGTESVIASADLAIVNQEVIIGGTELGISGYR